MRGCQSHEARRMKPFSSNVREGMNHEQSIRSPFSAIDSAFANQVTVIASFLYAQQTAYVARALTTTHRDFSRDASMDREAVA